MVDIYTVSTQRRYLHSVYLHSTHQASSSPLCCKTLHGLPHLTTPLTHWASQYAPIIWSKSFILLGFYILNWVKWPKENQRIQFLQEADIWKIFASHLWLQQPEGAAQAVSWLSVSFSVYLNCSVFTESLRGKTASIDFCVWAQEPIVMQLWWWWCIAQWATHLLSIGA